jgi:hypothetical protein
MAIESEGFGSCDGGIDVSVEIENRDAWACYELILLRLFGEQKRVKVCAAGSLRCQAPEAAQF